MPRLTRIYTRTGDDGTTGLGDGSRVPKSSHRIETYGLIDQLNSQIGVVLASQPVDRLTDSLRRIQNELFHLGSDLCFPEAAKQATPVPCVEQRHVTALEELMDELSEHLPPLENFILPGGSAPAAALHIARCVCRSAEREAIRLVAEEPIGPFVVKYLNRLSDALFVMARYQNKAVGVSDPLWNSRA
jgi:cob(I)alamin adenosyltransferase